LLQCIECRWADFHDDRLPALAADLTRGPFAGKQIHGVTASSEGEISAAFGNLVERQAGAFMVAPDSCPRFNRGFTVRPDAHRSALDLSDTSNLLQLSG